ncbi:DUF1360 domain-containing protein [Streptomyces sp. AMCC400023]|uniref:DUF1360 domain-containing protein n=1 Tax=Streptomyces sp. AMCC400023 TaxID=2056258 RepID=UPI001F433A52|nr:DUF1360 domain-containing protein [Streptomyces sp. AMCC400023]UJV42970.1 hypothetical protein CVT30_26800 [Streptomyces sp. AMCC400023]
MVSPTELAVLAFAAYRGTQLAVHDTILDVPRSWLYDWHSRKPESPLRNALVTLISCVYCMGWWVSGALLAAYLLWPDNDVVRIGLLWFAVAGGQALLNRWDDSRKADT